MSWRDRFREDNQVFLDIFGGYWTVRIYLFMMAVTIAHQARPRWSHCAGEIGCTLSFLKAFAWAAIWPFYWINYATDFVLLRPYG